ncbi:MAG: asparaginase [Ardenticatenia bacterium]|nr:asparaginase [Ardenticatenia bacterium]
MAKVKIAVITTGGTIAMRDEGRGGVPALGPEELLACLPADLREAARVDVEAFSNVPSNHLTLNQMWQLRKAVVDRLGRLYVCGAVVTHGTDTMEETAYLLDLTVPSERPVVLTGAMCRADEEGYDGVRNVVDAFRVALDPGARGRGTMIVMNGEIHAARYAVKVKSHGLDAFASPGRGPMGRVVGGQVYWYWHVERDMLPVREIEPDVHLIKATVGAPDTLLRLLVQQRPRGIVIEGFGGGRVPPGWMEPIREAVSQGTVVVVASRCPVGHTGDEYGYPGACRDLERAGVVLAGELSGLKARLKLMVALGHRE